MTADRNPYAGTELAPEATVVRAVDAQRREFLGLPSSGRNRGMES